MKKMSSSTLTILILALVVCSSIVGASLSYAHHRMNSVSTGTALLQLTANEKAAKVDVFLQGQREKIMILQEMEVFREVAMHPDDQERLDRAKRMIDTLHDIAPALSILTSDGRVIVSAIDIPGTDYSDQVDFSQRENDITFARYYDPLRKNEYYAIGGFLYDSPEHRNVIGVVAFDVELSKVSALMEETLDMGTDEVYLIDRSGLLLSRSEFIGKNDKNGVLVQEVKSDGAIDCLQDVEEYGRDGYVEDHVEDETRPYLNYMGDVVYGAHAYVPAIMGCVLAENDATAIAPPSFIAYLTSLFDEEEHEVPDEN